MDTGLDVLEAAPPGVQQSTPDSIVRDHHGLIALCKQGDHLLSRSSSISDLNMFLPLAKESLLDVHQRIAVSNPILQLKLLEQVSSDLNVLDDSHRIGQPMPGASKQGSGIFTLAGAAKSDSICKLAAMIRNFGEKLLHMLPGNDDEPVSLGFGQALIFDDGRKTLVWSVLSGEGWRYLNKNTQDTGSTIALNAHVHNNNRFNDLSTAQQDSIARVFADDEKYYPQIRNCIDLRDNSQMLKSASSIIIEHNAIARYNDSIIPPRSVVQGRNKSGQPGHSDHSGICSLFSSVLVVIPLGADSSPCTQLGLGQYKYEKTMRPVAWGAGMRAPERMPMNFDPWLRPADIQPGAIAVTFPGMHHRSPSNNLREEPYSLGAYHLSCIAMLCHVISCYHCLPFIMLHCFMSPDIAISVCSAYL